MTWVFQLNSPNYTDEPANNILAYTGTLNNDEYNRCGDKPGCFILKETRADIALSNPRQLKTPSSTPTAVAARCAAAQISKSINNNNIYLLSPITLLKQIFIWFQSLHVTFRVYASLLHACNSNLRLTLILTKKACMLQDMNSDGLLSTLMT